MDIRRFIKCYSVFGLPPMIVIYLLILLFRVNQEVVFGGFGEMILIVFVGALVPAFVAYYSKTKMGA